ncbi:MBL fold metallo-hydrolase [Pseudarthrobacter sp. SSS035]|uniref:MBL fold metallo-hydrolase n=1 Tax=Pseudarthrobacter sp. SSS035 TaxID=2931399 RepID=UPI00200E77C5|nr:MBL fold metallo-hydrolase [Pseudarthrobacter sp. SSS035]
MPRDDVRQIADGVWWLGGCLQAATSSGPVHYHVSTYLVVGEESAILIDSGDPAHEAAVLRGVAAVLGDRPLDYVFPTHPEIPHAGNVVALVRRYPGLRIVGDVRDYHLHWPLLVDRLVPMQAGDVLDLGGRNIEIHPAYIRDLHNTLWAFDSVSRMLFVSDGFAFIHETPFDELEDDEPIHRDDECLLTSSEFAKAVSVDAAAYGAGRSLYWTRFVDVSAAFDDIERLVVERDVRLVGPAHGAVIDDVSQGLRVAIGAHRKVFREGSGAMAPIGSGAAHA